MTRKMSVRIFPLWVLLFACIFNSHAQFSFVNGTAQTSNSGAKAVRLLNEVSTHANLSRFGGNLNVKTDPTGYFYIKKINGIWYLVDPEGYLFFTVGVNSVEKGGGMVLPDILWNIGANTLGCWSDETINDETARKMPYCPRWNFMATYRNGTQRTKDLYAAGIIPVFDPEYLIFCDNHARQLAEKSNDEYLLGHFSDNELPLYDNTTYGNLLDRFLAIKYVSDPNRIAAENWIKARKGANYTIDDKDRELFHGFVAGTYYRITGEAIKKYDPNHLYLGSRLHGAAKSKPSIFTEAAKYVDMISINVYGVWTPSKESMDMWSAGDKPFFVTEFYAKAEDSGMGNATGAGWLVPTQQDRAMFFENFTLALIEHPGCVGYHYFRYIDNNDSNKGLLRENYEWWEPVKNSFYKVARDIYGLREFMTGKTTGLTTVPFRLTPRLVTGNTPGEIQVFDGPSDYHTEIAIYALNGTLVKTFSDIGFPFSFQMKDNPPGLYILKLKSGKCHASEKILLN